MWSLFLLNMNPRKLEMKEIKLNCDRFRPQSATCSRAGRRVWQLFSFAIFEDFLKKKNFKHNSKFNRTIEDLRIISRIVWNLLVKPETIPPSHVRLHQNFCTISNIPCDNEISTWIWFVSGQFPFHWGFKYRSNFGYAKYGIQENVGMILEKYIQA